MAVIFGRFGDEQDCEVLVGVLHTMGDERQMTAQATNRLPDGEFALDTKAAKLIVSHAVMKDVVEFLDQHRGATN